MYTLRSKNYRKSVGHIEGVNKLYIRCDLQGTKSGAAKCCYKQFSPNYEEKLKLTKLVDLEHLVGAVVDVEMLARRVPNLNLDT